VDGWAVDYVRLDPSGRLLGNPFCYRDERNLAAQKEVHTRISPEQLYALTGIQIVPINTLYQLYADSASGIPQNAHWINLPEFVLHHLGGKRVAEYTNATHTQLLGVKVLAEVPRITTRHGIAKAQKKRIGYAASLCLGTIAYAFFLLQSFILMSMILIYCSRETCQTELMRN